MQSHTERREKKFAAIFNVVVFISRARENQGEGGEVTDGSTEEARGAIVP